MADEYNFGRNLRAMREMRGLSQIQLAERITRETGVYFNPNRLSNWEIGDTKTVSDVTLRMLCGALSCSADVLLGLDPQALTAEELHLLERVRNLGPAHRRMIHGMIDHLNDLRLVDPADE